MVSSISWQKKNSVTPVMHATGAAIVGSQVPFHPWCCMKPCANVESVCSAAAHAYGSPIQRQAFPDGKQMQKWNVFLNKWCLDEVIQGRGIQRISMLSITAPSSTVSCMFLNL